MFSNPKQILDQCFIGEGMSVADVGAGSGHYSLLLSDMVKKHGRVYAVDVQGELLTKLKNEAIRSHKKNIVVLATDAEKTTSIAGDSLDRIIYANVFFHFDNKEGAVKEAKRLLKKNGRIVVIDWTDSFNMLGPHPEQVFTKEQAVKLFLKNNFDLEREITAGDHHYGLIFKHHE